MESLLVASYVMFGLAVWKFSGWVFAIWGFTDSWASLLSVTTAIIGVIIIWAITFPKGKSNAS